MGLNTIQNNTKWGAAANEVNSNFRALDSKVTQVDSRIGDIIEEVDKKIESVVSADKGIFNDKTNLESQYPKKDNKKDWFAFVGTTNPREKYVVKADGGSWIPTGEMHNVLDGNLGDYTQTGGSEKTAKELETGIQDVYSFLPKDLSAFIIKEWEQGGIPSTDPESKNRIRTDYIGVSAAIDKIQFPIDYKLFILEFNADKEQITYTVFDESTDSFVRQSDTVFFRFIFGKILSGSTTSISDGAKLSIYLGNLELGAWVQGGLPTTTPPQANRIHTGKIYVNSNSLNMQFPNEYKLFVLEFDKLGTQITYKTVDKKTENHLLEINTVEIQLVLLRHDNGNVLPSIGRVVSITQNLGTKYEQAISKNEVQRMFSQMSTQTAPKNNEIILFNEYDIIDYSNNYEKIDITDTSKDRSFPVCISKGSKTILSYIDRENHTSNSSANFIARTSYDGGITFDTPKTLKGFNLTTAYRIKGTDKVISAYIHTDREGVNGWYQKTQPVVSDFETLISSDFSEGFSVKSFLSIPDNPMAQIACSGTIQYHKGILYMSGRHNGQWGVGGGDQACLFKSNDLGETWEFVSNAPTKGAGECAICFDNDRLIMCNRVGYGTNLDTENNWIQYSDDFGKTWTAVRLTRINLHNPFIFMWNGSTICAGRLLQMNKPNSLGFVVLNDNYTIKSIIIFDSDTVLDVPSYHQSYKLTGEYLRIFSHQYVDVSRTKSKIFRMDIPLSVLNSMSNLNNI